MQVTEILQPEGIGAMQFILRLVLFSVVCSVPWHSNAQESSAIADSGIGDDELGEAAGCGQPETEDPKLRERLHQLPAQGNYYVAGFEVETAGGSAAALITFWKKSGEDWTIYSYRIVTP